MVVKHVPDYSASREKVSKLFLDPMDEYDSIVEIKSKITQNGGVLTKADIVDPSLDGDAVDAYLEANPKVKVLDQLYPESEKKDVEDVTKSFKTYLGGLSSSFSIDQYGNVKDATGTFNIAYDAFLSEIKFNAYKKMDEAEALLREAMKAAPDAKTGKRIPGILERFFSKKKSS